MKRRIETNRKFGIPSLVAQMVKNLLAVWESWNWSLDGDDPLKKGMATHYSILAWRISWTEESPRLQSMGWQRVKQGWDINTFILRKPSEKLVMKMYRGRMSSGIKKLTLKIKKKCLTNLELCISSNVYVCMRQKNECCVQLKRIGSFSNQKINFTGTN